MSELQDKRLTCTDCGGKFLWSANEQAFFAEKGFTNEPRRCKTCLKAKKERFASNRRDGKR